MQSPLYNAIFPGTILTKTAENFLETSQGGLRYATNVGGEIAGFRANYIILDDPMQPDDSHRAEAKQKLVDWHEGVIAQRLLAEGTILVVMHRLAPDDFCATLQEAGHWHVVKLPLIGEEEHVYKDYRGHVLWHRKVGEVLNRNYRNEGEVATLKRELSPRGFRRAVSAAAAIWRQWHVLDRTFGPLPKAADLRTDNPLLGPGRNQGRRGLDRVRPIWLGAR